MPPVDERAGEGADGAVEFEARVLSGRQGGEEVVRPREDPLDDAAERALAVTFQGVPTEVPRWSPWGSWWAPPPVCVTAWGVR